MTRELHIYTPDGKKSVVGLDRDRLVLGRSSGAELCYADDAGLSRQHLAFERLGASWVVRDLGSKNGSQVNSRRLAGEHTLQPGDRVAAGHLSIDFIDPSMSDSAHTVVFVERDETAGPASTTVITSLEGLLGTDGSGEHEQAFESGPQMRALIRAGRELAGHRPLEDLFRVIMDLSVEAVGGTRGVLMTLEADELVVKAARGEGFRISATVRDRVLRERKSLLVRDAQLDAAFKAQMSIVEQKVRSILAVPLQTNDRVIGLIYLDSPHFVREFTREDLNLLTVMANVAAIRIEHARLNEVEQTERLMANELGQAAEIQRGLLPTSAPRINGVDLAGYNAACRTVGGDYYDFLTYPDGRVAMLVGDVAGKGMPAALLMTSLQARVQVLFEDPSNLAEQVTRLNRAIVTNCPSNRFITFFIGVYDTKTGEMDYTNAGHNPPLLIRRDGSFEQLDGGGPILGILPKVRYEQRKCKLETGDMVVLYRDGVTEASRPGDGEEFGEERLARMLAGLRGEPAAAIVDAVNAFVTEWTAGAPPADDITLVVARRTG